MHRTGLVEHLSTQRVFDDVQILAAEEESSDSVNRCGGSECSELLQLRLELKAKLKLMLSYKRFTTMDPSTRLQTLQQSANLMRTTQLEIMRNEMFALTQQF